MAMISSHSSSASGPKQASNPLLVLSAPFVATVFKMYFILFAKYFGLYGKWKGQVSYTSCNTFSLFHFGLMYCVILIFHRKSWSINSSRVGRGCKWAPRSPTLQTWSSRSEYSICLACSKYIRLLASSTSGRCCSRWIERTPSPVNNMCNIQCSYSLNL